MSTEQAQIRADVRAMTTLIHRITLANHTWRGGAKWDDIAAHADELATLAQSVAHFAREAAKVQAQS